MELRLWKALLLQWVQKCNFVKNISCLEDCNIEKFFEIYAQYAQVEIQPEKSTSSSETTNTLGSIQHFLRDFYPGFKPQLVFDGCISPTDYIYVFTLLMYHTCVQCPNEYFHNICKNLPDTTQQYIAEFFQQTVNTLELTCNNLHDTIENIRNITEYDISTSSSSGLVNKSPSKCPNPSNSLPIPEIKSNIYSNKGDNHDLCPTGNVPNESLNSLTPTSVQKELVGLQVAPPTPKSELLEQRTRELFGLRAQLATERYEKTVLEEQILENENLITSLSKENMLKKKQLARLTATLQNENDEGSSMCKYEPNELENLKQRLFKELSNKDMIISECNERMQELHAQYAKVNSKFKASENQLLLCMDRIDDLELRLENQKQQLADKDDDIGRLQRDNFELHECLKETRAELHKGREVLNASSDLLDTSQTAGSMNTTPENLACSVIDKQLREKELENTELREQLRTMAEGANIKCRELEILLARQEKLLKASHEKQTQLEQELKSVTQQKVLFYTDQVEVKKQLETALQDLCTLKLEKVNVEKKLNEKAECKQLAESTNQALQKQLDKTQQDFCMLKLKKSELELVLNASNEEKFLLEKELKVQSQLGQKANFAIQRLQDQLKAESQQFENNQKELLKQRQEKSQVEQDYNACKEEKTLLENKLKELTERERKSNFETETFQDQLKMQSLQLKKIQKYLCTEKLKKSQMEQDLKTCNEEKLLVGNMLKKQTELVRIAESAAQALQKQLEESKQDNYTWKLEKSKLEQDLKASNENKSLLETKIREQTEMEHTAMSATLALQEELKAQSEQMKKSEEERKESQMMLEMLQQQVNQESVKLQQQEYLQLNLYELEILLKDEQMKNSNLKRDKVGHVEYNRINDENQTLQQLLARRDAELEKCKVQLDLSTKRLEKMAIKLGEQQAFLSKTQRERNAVQEQIVRLERNSEKKIRELQQQIKVIEQEKVNLMLEVGGLNSEIAQKQKSETEINKVQEQLTQQQGKAQQLELDCQILQAKYREAKDEIDRYEQKLKVQRLEMEGKLEKMKSKMRALYNEEMIRMKEKQERDAALDKLEVKKLTNENTKYEEHTRKLSCQIVRLNDKILEQQKEHAILSTKLRHLQEAEYAIKEDWQPFKRPNAPSANIGSNLAMEDEEGEVFNNTYLTDLKLDRGPDITAEELQYRNSLQPPHLKSAYAAQYDLSGPEVDRKEGPHSLDDSMSALLGTMGHDAGTRKKSIGTHYKRPGPPTPSKNGGRLSFGNSEPPREILRENNGVAKTPARFKMFASRFSIGSSVAGGGHCLPRDENSPPKRRLSNMFKRK